MSNFNKQHQFSKPRRIVTRSGGILRGIFASTKYNKQIRWEAGIEKDAVALFEFSSHILDVSSQPFRSTFMNDEKMTSRTPDFLVITKDEKIIVECKPSKKMNDPLVVEHLAIASNHFEKLGYRYVIATDQILRQGSLLKNARHLLPFRMRQMQNKKETARIYKQLDYIKRYFLTPTFIQAVRHLGSETDVLVMMASGHLFFDFQSDIQQETLLSYSPLLETHDAASFLFN